MAVTLITLLVTLITMLRVVSCHAVIQQHTSYDRFGTNP